MQTASEQFRMSVTNWNRSTHEVQIQRRGSDSFVVVESFLTRGKADQFAADLGQNTGRPVRINSPLAP